jgi:23S rRNA (cytosine1962-C5)-methyltransferase
VVALKSERDRVLERRHPWIFSGSIDHVSGSPGPGDTVEVVAEDGSFHAWAAYSPASQIRARAWSFEPEDFPDEAWLRSRIERAIARRGTRGTDRREGVRLVHGESDGLPGLVVDRYAGVVVVQLLSAGVDARRESIAAALREVTGCADIFERSDADVRALEGLPARTGVLLGSEPLAPVEIVENGLRFLVDVRTGHKTGFYLDQRDNRARIRSLAAGHEVLNCFSYTGGFAIAALAGGAADVLSIDTSADALELGRRHVSLNGLEATRAGWLEADVFAALRKLRDQARSFDLIVLDPPKFAPTARLAQAAARGYKDINLNALKLLRPGGVLATFSCSGGIPADLFQKIVAGAAADAGISASILERFHASADHPVRLEFPEGEYLKGLLLRREE